MILTGRSWHGNIVLAFGDKDRDLEYTWWTNEAFEEETQKFEKTTYSSEEIVKISKDVGLLPEELI